MKKSMFPREFVEWLLFGDSSIYAIKTNNKFWSGEKDDYVTLDEVYIYWLIKRKNKDEK